MKRNNMMRIIGGGLLLTAPLLVACSDDLGNGNGYGDGRLHLKLSFNDAATQWKDGSQASTRALATIPMSADGMEGLKLYLHCKESPTPALPSREGESPTSDPVEMGETRGQRITGDAFDGRNLLPSFGLCALDEDNIQVLDFTKQLKSNYSNYSGGYYESSSDIELTFPGSTGWPDNKSVTFYGYAPDPTDAKNIAVSTVGGVPTLTYTMQDNEGDNKDILAAQTTLTRLQKDSEGVKLEFRHILSAIKFKGTTLTGIKATVTGESTEFYLEVNQIHVDGIYKTGLCTIGENPVVWSRTSDEKGECFVTVIDNTTEAINSDEHCLMILPQTAPDGAKLTFDCTVRNKATDVIVKNHLYITAPLAGCVWEPGHSYTYSIDDTELTHIMNISSTGFDDFLLEGGEDVFTVQSYYTNGTGYQADGIPADWHMEYKDENGIWVNGLPMGYVLLDENDEPVLDEHLTNVPTSIPGSVTPKTYKLDALTRIEKSEIIPQLLEHQYGSATEAHDLSLHDVTGSALPNGRSTANCYIINGYGRFKFPLVYGNAIKNGAVNEWAYTERDANEIFVNYLDNHISSPYILTDTGKDVDDVEAFIIWQDEEDLVLPSSVKLTGSGENAFMDFSIVKPYVKSGNIILGLREKTGEKRILWSWHIWVSARKYNETVEVSNGTYRLDFTQFNLGWRVAETKTYAPRTTEIRIIQNTSAEQEDISVTQAGGTVTTSGSNLYYQHGRKDPMPATYLENGTQKDMALTIYKLGYCNDWWSLYPNATNPTNAQIIAPVSTPTMGYAIQHPYYLYAANTGDWMYAGGNNYERAGRWDPEKAGNYTADEISSSATFVDRIGTSPSAYSHIKTIYDPCPIGFAVPPCSAYELLFDWETSTETGTDEGLNSVKFYGPTGSLTFSKTGWRVHTNPGNVENLNRLGYYWTAGVKNEGVNQGWYLRINNNNTFEAFTYCRNHTEPIRAVRDNEDIRKHAIDSSYEIPTDYSKYPGEVEPESSLVKRK